MKKKKASSARTLRRAGERVTQKEAEERKALARALPGGRPENPIEVATAAVVEVRAVALGCPVCGEPPQMRDHRALGELRVVELSCRHCGTVRTAYFRIAAPLLH